MGVLAEVGWRERARARRGPDFASFFPGQVVNNGACATVPEVPVAKNILDVSTGASLAELLPATTPRTCTYAGLRSRKLTSSGTRKAQTARYPRLGLDRRYSQN